MFRYVVECCFICIVLVILLVCKYFSIRSFWKEFRLVFYGLGNGLLCKI